MELLDDWLVDPPVVVADSMWAQSGAMALTGEPDGPVFDPGPAFAGRLHQAAAGVVELARRRGACIELDGCALLGERAAIGQMHRAGTRSVGGLAELVAVADGWVALNLARPEDVELLPVLAGRPVDPSDWSALRSALGQLTRADVSERAADLGLPVATVPDEPLRVDRPLSITAVGSRAPVERPLVVELASLWAGPLCGDLLARSGCRVLKVETADRPDGARRGNAAFFDVLNGAKSSVVIDRTQPADRELLTALLDAADVVVDGSRPRVMPQWGVDVDAHVAGGTVWVSITGYGRTGDDARRVAFGDDAAAAAGLVVPGAPPRFVADAAADPITGLYAALAALVCLDAGITGLVSAPLRQASAYVGATAVWAPVDPANASPPRARRAVATAMPLGAATAAVRAELLAG